ncbi:MAG: AbrB family transcriptional regulator [Herbinix sp.]|jgi:transcriptional pleiotropic regulator of transition state genes|nr:AbrB family transcriptional regulator [Herbinix sp.]
MANGIVRKIDELGRIVIPIEYRKSFSIKEKDPIGLYIVDGVIHLVKADGRFRGIARELDDLGRLCLPIEARRSLGFEDHQAVDIYVEDEEICIRKNGCEWCSNTEDLCEINGHKLCRKCAYSVVDVVMEA